MKGLTTAIALCMLLAACGRAEPTPAAPPRTGVANTLPATEAVTHAPATATEEDVAARIPAATRVPAPDSPPGPLPRVVATITLEEEPGACAGSALAVDPETGYLYSAGVQAHPDDTSGTPCLAVIDPTTSQIVESHGLPFAPRFLEWDGGTLYAIGRDNGALTVADAGTGQLLARGLIDEGLKYQTETQVVVQDGWAYVGLAGDPSTGLEGALYLIPLRGGATQIIRDAHAFDLANDGRFATVGGAETSIVRVYGGTDGALLAEREIGPGQPGESLAFDGWADRIFVSRRVPEDENPSGRTVVDILDAASLEPVGLIEAQVWRLTADPSRGRIYGYTPGGQIVGFDAPSGQPLGALFSIPPGDPAGFTVVSPWEKLHIDSTTGHIHVTYMDFDNGTWAAGLNPATGVGVADVQVPARAAWALDSARERIYFSSRPFLLALDAITLEPVWRMALSHEPVSAAIAPDIGLLFIGDQGGDVHVRNLQTYEEVERLLGVGGTVDVDPAHGWLYTGDEFTAGVSVYDVATLSWRGTIPQPGRPTASPADGQVYIIEEDVYSGDGTTLELIKGRTVRNAGCNGCSAPTDVIVDPRSGLIHVSTYGTWVGKPGPTSHAAVDPLSGRTFVAQTTGGYRVVYTLALYADLGMEEPLAWRDGLYGQPLPNPATGHLYLADGSRLLVLDDETLDLIGWLYPGQESLVPAAVDVYSGLSYFLAGPQVLVVEGSGDGFETGPALAVAGLPGPAEGIVPLPDGTLLVRAYDREGATSRLYRSPDAGQTWEELSGGLPGAPNDLTFTPDGTLYAAAVPAAWRAGTDEASWGEGIYRSGDGGDTWTPFSQGLAHLRVGRIHADEDGNVFLLSAGMWPEQPAWPVPTIWQLGGDRHWEQVEIPEAGPFVGPDGAVPAAYIQAIEAAWHTLTGEDALYRSWGSDLQRSTDGGQTWETAGTGPVDYGVAAFAGPGEQPAIYWLTWEALYRSTDGGASWGRLSHPVLDEGGPSAVAVEEWDGEETLFVGTEAGELLVLRAAEASWVTE